VSEHDGFRVERDAERGVAAITLDVPGKFNRVSMNARDELRSVFEDLDRDDNVRFVVLRGAGGAFTAGGDIPGFLQRSTWDVSRLADNVAAPERCTKPVIAALEGYCFGVGLELALACDFRVADETAAFGFPEIGLGILPSSGGTFRLVRMLGPARAKELVLLRERFSATEALAFGVVTEVVEEGRALARALELAERLGALPAEAVAMNKRVIDLMPDASAETALSLEALAWGMLAQTDEADDAARAFEERRRPDAGRP
jgi:2-oxoglutaroyl-CoA hydrolase